jgi:hypothetical protein
MKKIIIIPLLIAAIGAFGQTQVVSKVLGDNIWLVKGSFEITPIIATIKGDTARSVNYTLTVGRDTSSTTSYQISINLFDKSGAVLATDFISLTPSQYPKWTALINALDAYVQNKRPRLIKH